MGGAHASQTDWHDGIQERVSQNDKLSQLFTTHPNSLKKKKKKPVAAPHKFVFFTAIVWRRKEGVTWRKQSTSAKETTHIYKHFLTELYAVVTQHRT